MSKYEKFKYIIEHKITYDETQNVKDLMINNLNVYIIQNLDYNLRFLYITPKEYKLKSKIYGVQLDFIKNDLNNISYIKINNKDNSIKINQNLKQSYEIKLILRTLFFKKRIFEIPKEKIEEHFWTKFKTHTKKVVIDKPNWEQQYLKGIKYKSKHILNHILKGAKIDTGLKYLLISELFIFKSNKYIQFINHSIILTQGGTGKSSILGVLGSNLDDTSNAGIFGFYDAKKSYWTGGIVSQTKNPIILDEINEIISSGRNVLDTLNKPLDNGYYYYGKMGGQEVEISNQFLFIGNISANFTFSQFLVGVSNNILTFGRRIGFFIYNEKLHFKNGSMRLKKKDLKLECFSNYISNIFINFLENNNFLSIFENKNYLTLTNEYKAKIINVIRESEIDETNQFIFEHIKSLNSRLPFFILQIVFFENLFDIETKFNNNPPKFYIASKFYEKSREILDLHLQNIINIVNHEQNKQHTPIKEISLKQKLDKINKYHRIFIEICIKNKDFIKNNKILYPFENKTHPEHDKIKYLIKDCKKHLGSLEKLNKNLNIFGLKFKNEYVTIINKNIFYNLIEIYENKDEKEEINFLDD